MRRFISGFVKYAAIVMFGLFARATTVLEIKLLIEFFYVRIVVLSKVLFMLVILLIVLSKEMSLFVVVFIYSMD